MVTFSHIDSIRERFTIAIAVTISDEMGVLLELQLRCAVGLPARSLLMYMCDVEPVDVCVRASSAARPPLLSLVSLNWPTCMHRLHRVGVTLHLHSLFLAAVNQLIFTIAWERLLSTSAKRNFFLWSAWPPRRAPPRTHPVTQQRRIFPEPFCGRPRIALWAAREREWREYDVSRT